MVKGIEEIRLKLERFAFRELKVFQDRDVPIINPRSPQHVPPHVAVSKQRHPSLSQANTRNVGLSNRRPHRTNQVRWIDQEKPRRGARQTASMDTIRAWAECPHLPGVAEDLYRPNYIRPVQSFVRFAGPVARVKCEWVPRLERSNCGDRPSPQNVLPESAPVFPNGDLP